MRLSFRSIFPPPLFTERRAKLRPRGPPSRRSLLRKCPLWTSKLRKLRLRPTRCFCLTSPCPEVPTWVAGRSRSIGRSGGGHAHSEGSGLGSSVICGFDWRSGEMVVWAGPGWTGLGGAWQEAHSCHPSTPWECEGGAAQECPPHCLRVRGFKALVGISAPLVGQPFLLLTVLGTGVPVTVIQVKPD